MNTPHKILHGKLTITRPNNAASDVSPTIRVLVRDQRSRTVFLTLEIQAEEMMLALTGMAECECSLILNHLERVGKSMETKIEHVETPHPKFIALGPDECAAAAKPFETEGWTARLTDLNDSKRRVRCGVQAVTFFRWVEVVDHAPA